MSLLSDIAIAIKTKLGGTSTNNTIPRYDGTTCTLKKSNVTISDTDVVTAGGGFVGNLTGTASNATLAASATKLETARTINGVSFNGTANITIADPTKAPLTGGGTSGTWGISITGNASTANNAALAANATKLATERFINGVAFDGTSNITIADSTKAPLNGTGATGTWGINITGNSASTTKLATARTINGVSFDGTANITIADATKAPLVSPALTGTPTSTTATDGTNTTQIATTAFVQNAVGGYLSKAITGGTVNLTEAEASNPVIAFSGALTSAAVIVVPTTTKRIWAIYNATSGAFTLTVKTAAGNGVTVAQGKRNLVYTDGTHAYDAFNDYESITLTGVSSAPTAAVGTNTTQLATTAFVNAEIANDAPSKTGSGASGTWGISVSGNAATATKLATARTINDVAFDGSANITVTAAANGGTSAACSGNSATATKLVTARTINGVAFDGSTNITIADSTKAPLASPALSGVPTAPTAAVGTNNTQIATTAFVQANKPTINTSSVASATAGIGVGEVGSYAFMYNILSNSIVIGGTTAGSNLRYATAFKSLVTAASGTWRIMGNGQYEDASLWLRIA